MTILVGQAVRTEEYSWSFQREAAEDLAAEPIEAEAGDRVVRAGRTDEAVAVGVAEAFWMSW